MGVESDADRAVFLDTADFGVSVVYTRAGGSTVTIQGLFDEPATVVGFADGPGIASSEPRLTVRTVDLPDSAGDGDTAVVAGRSFIVRIRSDEDGMSTLVLEG